MKNKIRMDDLPVNHFRVSGASWVNINNYYYQLWTLLTFQLNEKCSLHIHNRFSASRGVPIPMGPLSVGNAVGIMIAHGNAGTALTRRTDVWMTRDGGYSWYKVGTANLCLHQFIRK